MLFCSTLLFRMSSLFLVFVAQSSLIHSLTLHCTVDSWYIISDQVVARQAAKNIKYWTWNYMSISCMEEKPWKHSKNTSDIMRGRYMTCFKSPSWFISPLSIHGGCVQKWDMCVLGNACYSSLFIDYVSWVYFHFASPIFIVLHKPQTDLLS